MQATIRVISYRTNRLSHLYLFQQLFGYSSRLKILPTHSLNRQLQIITQSRERESDLETSLLEQRKSTDHYFRQFYCGVEIVMWLDATSN